MGFNIWRIQVVKSCFLILLISGLGSCKWFTSAGSPTFAWTNIKVPEGTPVFKQGFKDGCSSSTYARGNSIYRMRYGFKFDPKLISNSEYRFGHQRGYTFCFLYMLQGDSGRGSFDLYLFPQGNSDTWTAKDINSAWGGFFDGLSAPIQPGGGGIDGIFSDLTAGGQGALSGNPLWAGGSHGQFFGQ
jgi:hypothetical protein